MYYMHVSIVHVLLDQLFVIFVRYVSLSDLNAEAMKCTT